MAEFVYCLCLVLVLILTIQNKDVTAALTKRTEQHPAIDFSRHTLIKPRIYHGREKRQISQTKDETNNHIDHVTITIPIAGKDYTLDLTLNKQLVSNGFFTRTQDKGSHRIMRPRPDELDFCHYRGHVRGKVESWVALSTCHGLSGVIFDGVETHYIEPNGGDPDSDHFLYKHADIVDLNKTCGFPDADGHEPHNHNNRMLRYKRASEPKNELIRGPYNSDKDSKYVELVLVVDNQEYKELGESVNKVQHYAQTIVNIINGLYAPLDIFIALVGVVIWTDHDEISFSVNGDTTLTNFLHYRREKLIKEHPNDNAQLLTKFVFDNGVVGKALKGPICTYEYSGGVNTDHSPVVGLVATTVAHEMGHNFGMEHDSNECSCEDDRCIMAPSSSSVAPTHWSSCSKNYLLLAFTHGMDYCLKNKPESLFNSPVCGNGFVEPGEQCDCGLLEHCDNTCCNATTCMLYGNASCATGECCDLNTCKPKTAGTTCRPAEYECDLPEYCTGQSEYCPDNIYKMDTEVCDNGNAFCYHGSCRTKTDQCRLLWGKTGKTSDDQCYQMNVQGSRHGNCGYNKFNQSFFKCDNDNALCGMLHCKHLNERLEFGMESVAILSHSFLNAAGSIIACRTAIVDLGINQIDPGLVPDGAKCGDGKMCVNQKCMKVDSLKLQTGSCPHNCNHNGVCNNLGHCHCEDGFAPPYCEDPGHGGSEDSGPPIDPNAHKEYIAALFIIFLGIIPLLVISSFVYYYVRNNGLHMCLKKPRPAMSKSPSKPRSPPFSPDSTTKRTEDNHSLLPPDQNKFFGHFKGFSLKPMEFTEQETPLRPAPAPPTPLRPAPPAPAATPTRTPQSIKHTLSGAFSFVNSASAAPALPPPNPGSSAKLIISSPILKNSTCTAKELISPLRNAPKVPARPAPEAPPKDRPPSSVETLSEPCEPPKKKESSLSLNRIASFLKPADKKPNLHKVAKIDKSTLRSIEISGPILQSEPDLALKTQPIQKEVSVTRAQSMRGVKVTPRPSIQSFGSMRQPGFKRPLSVASGVRPKSPPPPAPPKPSPEYQVPISQAQYDDCLNKVAPLAKLDDLSPSSSDNIYAVIEEAPTSPETSKSSPNANDSMGLLGEIVSEIQNRNFDSIYSTSTLARRKKEAEEEKQRQLGDCSNYVNIYKPPSPAESEYSNMDNAKSSASTSSSGYILPSAVNVPVKEPSSFKPASEPAKPTKTSPRAEKAKSPPSPTARSPKTAVSRQVTPPSLRTRKPSPTRGQKPRPVSNSPDLVTSCNTNKNKTPDVVNSGAGAKKPQIMSAKPTLNGLPKAPVGKSKAVSFKGAEKKPVAVSKTNSDAGAKAVGVGVKNAARSNSNVASLQQKFETKKSTPKVKT